MKWNRRVTRLSNQFLKLMNLKGSAADRFLLTHTHTQIPMWLVICIITDHRSPHLIQSPKTSILELDFYLFHYFLSSSSLFTYLTEGYDDIPQMFGRSFGRHGKKWQRTDSAIWMGSWCVVTLGEVWWVAIVFIKPQRWRQRWHKTTVFPFNVFKLLSDYLFRSSWKPYETIGFDSHVVILPWGLGPRSTEARLMDKQRRIRHS